MTGSAWLKNIFFLSIFLFSTFVFSFDSDWSIRQIPNQKIYQDGHAQFPLGPLNSNNSFKQQISEVKGKLFKIGIQVATYARINEGQLSIRVSVLEQEVDLFYGDYDLSKLADNSFLQLELQHTYDITGKTLVIHLSSNADEENSITIWGYKSDSRTKSFFVNDRKSDQVAMVTRLYVR